MDESRYIKPRVAVSVPPPPSNDRLGMIRRCVGQESPCSVLDSQQNRITNAQKSNIGYKAYLFIG